MVMEPRAPLVSINIPCYHQLAHARRCVDAMRNMFQSITGGRGKYTLAFHEDDLVGRHYLQAAVAILESQPSCGFVAAQLREFTEEPSDAQLALVPGDRAFD